MGQVVDDNDEEHFGVLSSRLRTGGGPSTTLHESIDQRRNDVMP